MFKQVPIVIKLLVLSFLLINTLFVVASFSMPNSNEVYSKGEKIFKANCSGCHINGQNLIRPDKPIIGSVKLQSKAVFKKFLESPPKPMPKFENITSMDNQFDSLYNYVITLMSK